MNCHLTVKKDSELLAPIRDSATSGRPMRWIRVHKLPDYAYFAHNAHVAAGIGCVSCHGRVDEMETITQMTAAQHELVPRLPPQSRASPAPGRRGHQHEVVTSAGGRRFLASLERERPVNPPTDCSGCHR